MSQYLITDVSVFISRELLRRMLTNHAAYKTPSARMMHFQRLLVATGGSVLRLIFEKAQ